MAFDYAPMAATALALVAEFGRSVTLQRLDRTPPDADKPWLGPVNPRATPAATLTVAAVFVEPGSTQELGLDTTLVDWAARATRIAVIASPADLTGYSELVDIDGTTWRIVGVSTLSPGSTRLLHFVGVSR
jgi:hypothetical protein